MGKSQPNNGVESLHSRGICILMGSALTQKQKGKPWVVVNMSLVERLWSCGAWREEAESHVGGG